MLSTELVSETTLLPASRLMDSPVSQRACSGSPLCWKTDRAAIFQESGRADRENLGHHHYAEGTSLSSKVETKSKLACAPDPALPKHITPVTLPYTFFRTPEKETAQLTRARPVTLRVRVVLRPRRRQ